jgi:hypothetical protein
MNIQTIVYLDLDSTGLREDGSPRISEISLAVNPNDRLVWLEWLVWLI